MLCELFRKTAVCFSTIFFYQILKKQCIKNIVLNTVLVDQAVAMFDVLREAISLSQGISSYLCLIGCLRQYSVT